MNELNKERERRATIERLEAKGFELYEKRPMLPSGDVGHYVTVDYKPYALLGTESEAKEMARMLRVHWPGARRRNIGTLPRRWAA